MDIFTEIDRHTLTDAMPDAEAVFHVDGGTFFDRDIGGSDGWEANWGTLVSIKLGDLQLDRAQAIAAFGADAIDRWEADELQRFSEREAS